MIEQTTEAPGTPSVYDTARTSQPGSIQSIATGAVLVGPFGEEDEGSVGTHHSSLFGSHRNILNGLPSPLPKDDRERAPPSQKRVKLGTAASKHTLSKNALNRLPASRATRNYTVSEPAHREGPTEASRLDDDWGRRLTKDLVRARTPAQSRHRTNASPTASRNSCL